VSDNSDVTSLLITDDVEDLRLFTEDSDREGHLSVLRLTSQ